MLNKVKSGFKAAWTFARANPITLLVVLFLAGIFVVPFLLFAFNWAREKSPEAVKKIVPAARPVNVAAPAPAPSTVATPTPPTETE